jgi:large subunit ribosomal protein L18
MNKATIKTDKRFRRHHRIRAKVAGTAERPRLAVYRSNRFVYAQLINDDAGVTLAASDTRTMKGTGARERARAVGKDIAEKAVKLGVSAVVFDRGGFFYTGVIKELADSAREAGLTF